MVLVGCVRAMKIFGSDCVAHCECFVRYVSYLVVLMSQNLLSRDLKISYKSQ